MGVKASFANGNINIPFVQLLEIIPAEERSELLKHVACDDQVIRDVTAQIIHKWTEDGWHGRQNITAQHDTSWPSTPAIDAAWREVAKASSDVAKREIERLEKALEEKSKEAQEAWDKVRRLTPSGNF